MKNKYFSSKEEESVYNCIVDWKTTRSTTASSVSEYLNIPVKNVIKHIENLEKCKYLVQDMC